MPHLQPSQAPFSALTLPNGMRIQNRLAKAAMEESLADDELLPGELLLRLYRHWARGGAGLMITGNVMIDPTALTSPGAVVLVTSTWRDLKPGPGQREAAGRRFGCS